MTPRTEDTQTRDKARADDGDATSSYVSKGKAFDRDMTYIPDRITADPGRSRDPHGAAEPDVPTWPVEPGRSCEISRRP